MRSKSGLLAALLLAACGNDELFKLDLGGSEELLGDAYTAKFTSDDQSAIAVESVGDLDGDGIDDAVIATRYTYDANDKTWIGGNVYIVYGGTNLTGDIDLDTLPCLTLGPNTFAGDPIAVGDLDGDGRADLVLVRSPGDAARVVYGRSTRFTPNQSLDDVAASVTSAPGAFVLAVSPLGDIDGDGRADLAFTRSDVDPGTVVDTYLVIHYGRSQQLTGTHGLAELADATIMATGAGSNHLIDALGMGDVDGDGNDDFIVRYLGNPNLASEMRLVRGSPTRLSGTSSLAAVASTDLSSHGFVSAVALGDLDGDGLADIALNTVDLSTPAQHQTRNIFYGRAGGFGPNGPATADATFDYHEPYERAPLVLAAADLDGDGHPELIVGDGSLRDSNGGVQVYAGTAQRMTGAIDQEVPRVTYLGAAQPVPRCEDTPPAYPGCRIPEFAGEAVAVGNFRGDHRVDLLIGSAPPLAGTLGDHGSAVANVYLVEP